jgi:guanosine-3',5'-bis(diphosphate) 3'-pyrophosphohydrolase
LKVAKASPIADVLRALEFAADRHREQRRTSPGDTPYVNHLIEVAAILARVGAVTDAEVLTAAVLHDVIEDTRTSAEELEQRFGPHVREMVCLLSDDKSLPQAERRRLVLEHLVHASDAIKLIKLADLTSNIGPLPAAWPAPRVHDYLEWSRQAAALCAGVSPDMDSLYQERRAGTVANLVGAPARDPRER